MLKYLILSYSTLHCQNALKKIKMILVLSLSCKDSDFHFVENDTKTKREQTLSSKTIECNFEITILSSHSG